MSKAAHAVGGSIITFPSSLALPVRREGRHFSEIGKRLSFDVVLISVNVFSSRYVL